VLQPVAASSQTARTSSPAQATSAATRNYSIPAGPLAQALNRFADASQLQLIYSGETTRGLRTDGLSGTYTPQQALDQLLSGSGLTYRFSGRSIVTIQNPGVPVAVGGAPAGAIQLDTVDVSGGRGRPEDRPFQTPGSVNYISEQDIQRFRGNTAGDMFQGTPGVISGMNRNGAAIDVNIRGLQGMNRVATTIDGSEQSTSSYRGYSGVDNRTYVDPDLISGVTITKGPSDRYLWRPHQSWCQQQRD
jgi:hemoglobin/transferrin/lactoferrin receptor protein